jgi:hypothetical protein
MSNIEFTTVLMARKAPNGVDCGHAAREEIFA